jgi:hypothetical protein
MPRHVATLTTNFERNRPPSARSPGLEHHELPPGREDVTRSAARWIHVEYVHEPAEIAEASYAPREGCARGAGGGDVPQMPDFEGLL